MFGSCSVFVRYSVRCLFGSILAPAGTGPGHLDRSRSSKHRLSREGRLSIRTAAEPHSRHGLGRNGSPRMPSHAVYTTGECWKFSDHSAVRLGSETQYLDAALRVNVKRQQSGNMLPLRCRSVATSAVGIDQVATNRQHVATSAASIFNESTGFYPLPAFSRTVSRKRITNCCSLRGNRRICSKRDANCGGGPGRLRGVSDSLPTSSAGDTSRTLAAR